MPLLIQNGLLMTMTEQGCVLADLLIKQGRIARIDSHIDRGDLDDGCVLDADGLVLVPGLIDLNICDDCYDAAYLAGAGLAAGITTHLQRTDGADNACLLTDAEGFHDAIIRHINPAAFTDEQLHAILHSNTGHVICSIHGRDECSRVLRLAEAALRPPILAELIGSYDMCDTILESGCSVIIGVRRCGSSPWALAARLDALGVPVAISSSHPAAQMKLLPVCAGLCMRDGMPRERAMDTITANPAAMLGLADRGRLAPGLRADITIFDGDPLLLASSHVMTIAGGHIVRRA